jgi:hypothetical protein
MAQAEVAPRGQGPWTERLYEAAGVAPAWVGVGVFAVLSALFVSVEVALGRHRLLAAVDVSELRDVRLAFVNFLLLAYLPTALCYLIRGTRRRLEILRPLFGDSGHELRRLADGCGVYLPGERWTAGILGVAGALLLPLLAEGGEYVYRPTTWSAEVVWHRITAPFIGWWSGQLVLAMIAESARFSGIAVRLPSLDLLDLRPLAPFARQGLANALAGVFLIAILSLFLLESGFGSMIAIVGALDFAACAAGLLLPVRGVHRRIGAAKQEELDWLRPRLRSARTSLAAEGRSGREGLADLLAWQRHLESVPDWPFDAPMLWRAALYLLIPLGSWAGGALVERLVDAVLG